MPTVCAMAASTEIDSTRGRAFAVVVEDWTLSTTLSKASSVVRSVFTVAF